MSQLRDWYHEYLQSSHWKETRKKAYDRYGRRCSVIGCVIKRLHIHHLSYEFLGEEQEINDVRPLCWLHHWLCHRRLLGFKKIPLNRKNLTLRYIQVKRFHWRLFKPSDWLRL